MTAINTIKLGIPKGSLESPTLAIFERVGLRFTGAQRSLWLGSNDSEIVPILLKPQEIPTYVKSGHLDAGLSGLDWITEQDVVDHVDLLAELPYSRQTNQAIRWVLAVPERSPVYTIDDLRAECESRSAAGSPFKIATELTHISNMWLARHGIDASAEFSWGATEAKASYFSDAIIEGTETGASLRANDLRVVAEVFSSTSRFFVNRDAYRHDTWKHQKLAGLAKLITGAVLADDLVQMTIVAVHRLDLLKVLSGDARVVTATGPTKAAPFHAVITLNKAHVAQVMPAVIAAGASDVWTAPLSVYYNEFSGLLLDQPGVMSAVPASRQPNSNGRATAAAVESLATSELLVSVGKRHQA